MVVAGKVGVFMALLEAWEVWERRPPVAEVPRMLPADKFSCGSESPTIMEEVSRSVKVLWAESCESLRWIVDWFMGSGLMNWKWVWVAGDPC